MEDQTGPDWHHGFFRRRASGFDRRHALRQRPQRCGCSLVWSTNHPLTRMATGPVMRVSLLRSASRVLPWGKMLGRRSFFLVHSNCPPPREQAKADVMEVFPVCSTGRVLARNRKTGVEQLFPAPSQVPTCARAANTCSFDKIALVGDRFCSFDPRLRRATP